MSTDKPGRLITVKELCEREGWPYGDCADCGKEMVLLARPEWDDRLLCFPCIRIRFPKGWMKRP